MYTKKNAHSCTHDNIIEWKHFPRYWPYVWGIHWSPVNSLHKGQWCVALMFSLICTWTNGWVSNWDAGDLRCHCAHYDITIMMHILALCCVFIFLLLDNFYPLFSWQSKAKQSFMSHTTYTAMSKFYILWLVQERRNSSALAIELHPSCTTHRYHPKHNILSAFCLNTFSNLPSFTDKVQMIS